MEVLCDEITKDINLYITKFSHRKKVPGVVDDQKNFPYNYISAALQQPNYKRNAINYGGKYFSQISLRGHH